ncbi:uncharacterized protein [Nicotiana sylvestris]|uniref:Uncharacterized protein LOC104215883 n=1 Tax=Nicotiana sylvestris TaxID=4096 RepID=A0A1U7V7K7_NICSY|nr:PREDICTED: uncharacterized protein LOC104215883 [Nicotiana sylvestris]
MAILDQIDDSGIASGSPISTLIYEPNIDLNCSFYIHPSDNPGAILVTTPFNGIGYRSWRRSVLRSLSVKNKLGFINGECKHPEPDSTSLRQWMRCDDMVTLSILNSFAKDIANSIEYANDAAKLWRELEDRYDQTNGTKLYQIQKEINDLYQGVLDVTRYYTKIKRLWEELNNLSAKSQCSFQCTCGAKESMHNAEQDRHLIQFLMGLNEVYTVVRGSILMMNPLPLVAQAFSLLTQEEKQREVRPNNSFMMESASMNVNTSRNISLPTIESTSLNVNTSRNENFKTNYSTGNHPNSKPRPLCDYCKRLGHTK